MLKRRIVPLLAATTVAIALLTLAACGGGKEEAKTPAAQATPAASPAASPAARSPGASPAAPAVPGDLGQLLSKASQAQFQATYEVKVSDGPDKATVTLVIKAGKSAFTIKAEDLEVTVIDDGQSSFLCGDLGGLVGGRGGKACYKSPRNQAGPGSELIGAFQGLNPSELVEELGAGANVQRDGSQTIAGRKASCFKVSSPEGQGRICLDESLGVVLLIEGKFDGEDGTFKATKFSDKVSDDAFKPPYGVKDISELGQ